MTDKDKLDKLVAEIERIYHQSLFDENRQAELGLSSAACTSYGKSKVCKELLSFTDSMQEEPKECMYSKDNYTDEDRKVLCEGCEEECEFNKKEESVGKRFAFKAIPRLLEMIEPTDRAKVYVTKLADALEVEGYSTDAKIVMESLKIMNGEKVPMATMDEEPVSEEFEEALAKEWKGYVDRGAATVDALEDNTQELTFAKGFYRGAKWQKEQMMSKAVDATVHIDAGGYPYIPQMELYDYDKDIPLAKRGDKVKILIVKES